MIKTKSKTPPETQPMTSVDTPILHDNLPPPPPTLVTTHSDIAQRAYDIYVQNGQREDQCDQNWQQAEQDLREQGLVACQAEHSRKEVFAPDAVNTP